MVYMPHIQRAIHWQHFMAAQDPVWDTLPQDWDEGPFLGNGQLGALIFYQCADNAIRFEICHARVIDHRDAHQMPVSFACARLRIGHFLLRPTGQILDGNMRLSLYDACATGEIRTTAGSFSFSCLCCATHPSVMTQTGVCGTERLTWEWHADEAISPRQKWGLSHGEAQRTLADYVPNPAPYLDAEGAVQLCIQPLLCGASTAVAWTDWGDTRAVSVAHTTDDDAATLSRAQAVRQIRALEADSGAQARAAHADWWHTYYPKSFFSVPDADYENFYWIQLYKLGSAARSDGPVIDNHGPWLWDTAWPYATWNLNVQLSYWLTCASNHTELGESLIQTLCENLDHLVDAAPQKYQEDSAALDTVGSIHCVSHVPDPLTCAGHAEIGNLTWALHNCWLMYRHTMERGTLERIYPVLRRAVAFLAHFLYTDADGHLHFRPSASPEYREGCPEDCNYTLSLFRWGAQTLVESAALLGIEEPRRDFYEDALKRLVDYPGDDTQGFYIGQDLPYAYSHRHYSHLLMIYPLYLVHIEQPGSRERIEKSLRHWQSMPLELRGYSCTGGASIAAAIGDGNEALRYLSGLWSGFLRPNTMYRESGPVIETPLSGAQSLLDMALQSWGGTVRIFPAIPDAWDTCCFDGLLAQGAFLVAARREKGETVFVEIQSLKGEPCVVQARLGGAPCFFGEGGALCTQIAPDTYRLSLQKGERGILMRQGAQTPLCITPCADREGRTHCYGINARARQLLSCTRDNFELR